MKRELYNEQHHRRIESRLGGSLALGLALGAVLGLVVGNIIIGLALGFVLGVAVGSILALQGEEAKTALGDPNKQRVVALIISFLTFLLFVGLIWQLLSGA